MVIVLSRHTNGITLNPLECLINDEGDIMLFDSEEHAKEYLKQLGFTEEEMHRMVFMSPGEYLRMIQMSQR